MSDKTYVFEQTPQTVDAVTASLLGRNNGGMFGGNGLEGLIGLIIAAGIFGGGNGNGWFGGGGNNNAEREMLMQAINRNGTDLATLASNYNCSIGQVNAAINGLAGQICKLAGDQGISSERIINSILSGNAAITNQLAQCCCELNGTITRGFADLGYATRDQTCSIEKAIAASTAEILAGQRAAEMREMQEKINTLQEEKQTYKLGTMMAQNSAPLAAAINALQADVNGIKCKLPETATVPYSPVVGIPNCVAAQYGLYGFPFGFNGGNGSFF